MFKLGSALSLAAIAAVGATTIDDDVYYQLGQAVAGLNLGMCQSF